MLETISEADAVRKLAGSIGARAGIPPQIIERQLDVLLHRQLGDEMETLKNETEVAQAKLAERVVVERLDLLILEKVAT